jgi:hypothetical protein
MGRRSGRVTYAELNNERLSMRSGNVGCCMGCCTGHIRRSSKWRRVRGDLIRGKGNPSFRTMAVHIWNRQQEANDGCNKISTLESISRVKHDVKQGTTTTNFFHVELN